jgi:hypothetical protein
LNLGLIRLDSLLIIRIAIQLLSLYAFHWVESH